MFDSLSPRRTGRRRCRPHRAQQADVGHDVAFGGPGPGAALDPQPYRSHPIFHCALFPARSRNRPGHRLDQQGLAVDRHQPGPPHPHQAPGGAGPALRGRCDLGFRRRGQGTLAADERRRRARCRLVAGRRRVSPSDLCAALVKGARSRGAKIFEDTAASPQCCTEGGAGRRRRDRRAACSMRCDAHRALCTGLWSRGRGRHGRRQGAGLALRALLSADQAGGRHLRKHADPVRP